MMGSDNTKSFFPPSIPCVATGRARPSGLSDRVESQGNEPKRGGGGGG